MPTKSWKPDRMPSTAGAAPAAVFILSCMAAVGFSNAAGAADKTFRVCIGQYEHLCPTAKQAWFPCGTAPEEAARTVCTIHTAAGPTVKPFRMLKVFDVSGNRCGYAGIDVICID
jgi:hypothetical protein